MRLDWRRHRLAFAAPLRSAHSTLREREILAVSLSAPDGAVGHGEAAPLQPYDGVSVARTIAALERHREALTALGPAAGGAQLLDACRAADPLPQALAAVDMALWDLAGRREGLPLCALLADSPQAAVAVNAMVSADGAAQAQAQAGEAASRGYGCVKVKVGLGGDLERVRAVREAVGADVALRLDANGAWSPAEAVAQMRELAEAAGSALEMVEEPTHGLAGTAWVRERVAVPIAIDETAAEPGALCAGAAAAVCLKISRCGGVSGLLAAATLARACGAQVYVASTLDGPLGVAAAVHAAAALGSRGPLPHCGLATLSLFAGLEDQLPARDGAIAVPQAAGLGVEPV